MMIFINFDIVRCTDVRYPENSGDNTFRDAIECAQEGDTIDFEYTVFGDTIALLTTLIIDKDITIVGFPSKNVTISGAAFVGSNFSIAAGKTVNINGIKINCLQGDGDGRCLVNSGILKLNNIIMIDTNSSSTGSSVFNTGSGDI